MTLSVFLLYTLHSARSKVRQRTCGCTRGLAEITLQAFGDYGCRRELREYPFISYCKAKTHLFIAAATTSRDVFLFTYLPTYHLRFLMRARFVLKCSCHACETDTANRYVLAECGKFVAANYPPGGQGDGGIGRSTTRGYSCYFERGGRHRYPSCHRRPM